ncbi:DUF4262 domain-containing protein [Streptomyces sp. MBT62]|uniref:DUF4262 domain-containing protein n=1 Tax=Streptomyces sp. MBT62 TaxID=2800410 RepID=UPI00190D087F|nr:DUF4262 domain-containing protein [Streptomyces sp. MBT62]MBK3564458.1 DUF4262 domain-containing protein [Streptomyces sp. MBT62]
MATVIAEHGHAVQYVGGDPTMGEPPFAYTVGLHTRPGRAYELAFAGGGPDLSTKVLNSLAIGLADRGVEPTDGLEIGGLLQRGLDLRLRMVTRPEDLGVIHAIYGTTPPVWQALWPDRNDRFPGDSHYNLPATAQPLL